MDQVNRKFALQLEDSDLERAVHQAVELANRDVAGFAFNDSARFLDYTWKLLPESSFALRRRHSCTLGEGIVGAGRRTLTGTY